MNALLSSTDEEEKYRLIDQWCLPWRSEQWVSWALQEYDPEFPLDAPSVTAAHISTRDLVRAASASPGEVDVGYETVAMYRKRYGIRMASSVVEEPVDASTPTQAETTPAQTEASVDTAAQLEASLDTPAQAEAPIDTLAPSEPSIDTPTPPEASVDPPTQPEPPTESQAPAPTVYQQYVFDHRSPLIGTGS